MRSASSHRKRRDLDWEKVREIRRRYAEGGISLSALGREYGVDTKQIHRVVRNEAWRESE